MSIEDIKNRNFQSQLNFEFRVDRLSDFNFFVQKVNIPTLSMAAADGGGTPLSNIPWPGDRMTFGELSVEFKVSEGIRNWYEIFSWMQGITFPEKQAQFGALRRGELKNRDGEKRKHVPARANGDIYGQGLMFLNSSANNPLALITFVDLYPISLSEAVFNTVDADVTHVTSTVNFKYDYFTVEKIG